MDEKLREAIDALQKALPKGAAAMILWEKEPIEDSSDDIGGEFIFPDGGMTGSGPHETMEEIAVYFGMNVSAGKNEMG